VAPCILLVEQEPACAERVRRAFGDHSTPADLTVTATLAEARAYLARSCPHLVIANLDLPDGRGTDLLPDDPAGVAFPLIVLAARDDDEAAAEAIEAGALDCVVRSDASLAAMPRIAERATRQWRRLTERRQCEETLRPSRRELAVHVRIANIFLAVPDDETYGEVLQVVLEELQSKYGVFGYLDENGALVCPSMTRDIWDQCRMPDKAIVFPREKWGGIWGRALVERKTLYSNQPLRVPEGHVPVSRALVVPIVHREEVVGILEAANKATDYDQADIALLEAVAAHVAPILHARLARDQQERRNKRAEEKIEDLARFPSENPYPVLRISADGTVLYANAAAGRLLADWDCGLGQPAPEPWRQLARQTLQTGSPDVLEEAHRNITVLFAAVPVPDKGYVNVYGVDITDRRLAREERERLIAELERKNAELERFTYTVSHDLKGPLITIKGFAGLLSKEIAAGNSEQVHEDLRRISKAADRMHQLLDELLDLSRVGRLVGPPRDVSLSDLAREAMGLMAIRIRESGTQVHVPDDLPVVRGDRPRLLSVMQNLLDNAVKFMGDQAQPRIEIDARREGAETVCWVRDNGIGIDPKYHDRVFGLFDQLNRDTPEGTGIGLALVKRIVEVHGGRIWIESEGKGRGSTFCFSLPRKGESDDGEEE